VIESLKDLERLLKICRKQGVTEIKLKDVEFKLGDLPMERGSNEVEIEDPLTGFPEGELTPEQLMFYSSGGLPADDPALKAG
jgi:hypothetical protein